jgi:hypothetical protein
LFDNILLFDIPKDLLDVFLERIIISKHTLDYISYCGNNFFFNYLIVHEIVNVSLDPVKGYIAEVADNIYYFSRFATKQVLVEKNINIYRYKEVVEFSSIFIKDIRCLNGSSMFLYRKY